MVDRIGSAESSSNEVILHLRVPGPWVSPEQLDAALRDRKTGYHLEEDSIVDDLTAAKIHFDVTEHDDQLGPLFRGGHEDRMTEEELLAVGGHAVKIHVVGPGGSFEANRLVVDAAAALIRAGGFGVFVDNSGNCHGPDDFLKLADDPEDGGMYWIFVTATGDRNCVFSIGMHCLGFRDAEMHGPPEDPREAWREIHEFLGYSHASGREIHDGDRCGAEPGSGGPVFTLHDIPCTRFERGTAFFNPFGVWKMIPFVEE